MACVSRWRVAAAMEEEAEAGERVAAESLHRPLRGESALSATQKRETSHPSPLNKGPAKRTKNLEIRCLVRNVFARVQEFTNL